MQTPCDSSGYVDYTQLAPTSWTILEGRTHGSVTQYSQLTHRVRILPLPTHELKTRAQGHWAALDSRQYTRETSYPQGTAVPTNCDGKEVSLWVLWSTVLLFSSSKPVTVRYDTGVKMTVTGLSTTFSPLHVPCKHSSFCPCRYLINWLSFWSPHSFLCYPSFRTRNGFSYHQCSFIF